MENQKESHMSTENVTIELLPLNRSFYDNPGTSNTIQMEQQASTMPNHEPDFRTYRSASELSLEKKLESVKELAKLELINDLYSNNGFLQQFATYHDKPILLIYTLIYIWLGLSCAIQTLLVWFFQSEVPEKTNYMLAIYFTMGVLHAVFLFFSKDPNPRNKVFGMLGVAFIFLSIILFEVLFAFYDFGVFWMVTSVYEAYQAEV